MSNRMQDGRKFAEFVFVSVVESLQIYLSLNSQAALVILRFRCSFRHLINSYVDLGSVLFDDESQVCNTAKCLRNTKIESRLFHTCYVSRNRRDTP